MNAPLEQIAGYGVTGALLVVALVALRFLYQELAAERTARAAESAARIQDAKDGATLLLNVQKEILAAVDKLTDLYTMVQDERREEKARRADR